MANRDDTQDQSIKQIIDDEGQHLKIDNKMLKAVRNYGQSFVNRNEDHVNFFSSNLLGVYPVRFRTGDKDEWFDDILEMDDSSVKARVVSLPHIDENWVRGTDPFNLTCLWLTHKIYNADLSSRAAEQGMMDVLMVLHFKLISSIMAHYFPYPVDKQTAEAVYASLSKKFALKEHGSWYALIEARCQDIISKDSIHRNAIELFDDDDDIQRMITDIQGRLRAIVKKLWQKLDIIRQQDSKVMSINNVVEHDGEELVKDVKRDYSPYRRYIHNVFQDRTRLIKDELVQVISRAMHTMPEQLLTDTLLYMVENYERSSVKVDEFIDEVVLHAFEFLTTHRADFARTNDLGSLIIKMRSVYMSSRSKDRSLMKMRKEGEKIVSKAVKSKNQSTIAAVRTGVMLYIVARTFTMHHYE